MKRVNIGCGPAPIPGWHNYDNSLSVRLGKHSIFASILDRFGFLTEGQKKLISVARNSDIVWADATKRIPFPDSSIEVLYTSHMVEHLDREEVQKFLEEANRVLNSDGIIRIVVPDLRKLATQYITNEDADLFVEKSRLAGRRHRRLLDKLKYLIIGDRHHLWMYDGLSICRLLSVMGFKEPQILPAGSTIISDPDGLNLYEREDESVYVEAYNT